MVLRTMRELHVAGDAAAEVRNANWQLVRGLAAKLGDTWDLERSTFELLCECGRPACNAAVAVALSDYVQSRTNGYDVVLPFHEDPLDLVVYAKTGYRVIARARAGKVSSGGAVGDWTCACGQEYRAAARGSHVVLWPRNSAAGFRREPIGERCVSGCEIDRLAVLHALVAPATAA